MNPNQNNNNIVAQNPNPAQAQGAQVAQAALPVAAARPPQGAPVFAAPGGGRGQGGARQARRGQAQQLGAAAPNPGQVAQPGQAPAAAPAAAQNPAAQAPRNITPTGLPAGFVLRGEENFHEEWIRRAVATGNFLSLTFQPSVAQAQQLHMLFGRSRVFVFSGGLHDHGVMSFMRYYLTNAVLREVKRAGFKNVIDVGGTPARTYRSDLNVHTCAPMIEGKDVSRRDGIARLLDLANLTDQEKANLKSVCDKKVQTCACMPDADAMMFIFTAWYLTRDELMEAVLRTSRGVAYVVVLDFQFGTGTFCGDEMSYEIVSIEQDGSSVVQCMVRDDNYRYVHDAMLWLPTGRYMSAAGTMTWSQDGSSVGPFKVYKFHATTVTAGPVPMRHMPLLTDLASVNDPHRYGFVDNRVWKTSSPVAAVTYQPVPISTVFAMGHVLGWCQGTEVTWVPRGLISELSSMAMLKKRDASLLQALILKANNMRDKVNCHPDKWTTIVMYCVFTAFDASIDTEVRFLKQAQENVQAHRELDNQLDRLNRPVSGWLDWAYNAANRWIVDHPQRAVAAALACSFGGMMAVWLAKLWFQNYLERLAVRVTRRRVTQASIVLMLFGNNPAVVTMLNDGWWMLPVALMSAYAGVKTVIPAAVRTISRKRDHEFEAEVVHPSFARGFVEYSKPLAIPSYCVAQANAKLKRETHHASTITIVRQSCHPTVGCWIAGPSIYGFNGSNQRKCHHNVVAALTQRLMGENEHTKWEGTNLNRVLTSVLPILPEYPNCESGRFVPATLRWLTRGGIPAAKLLNWLNGTKEAYTNTPSKADSSALAASLKMEVLLPYDRAHHIKETHVGRLVNAVTPYAIGTLNAFGWSVEQYLHSVWDGKPKEGMPYRIMFASGKSPHELGEWVQEVISEFGEDDYLVIEGDNSRHDLHSELEVQVYLAQVFGQKFNATRGMIDLMLRLCDVHGSYRDAHTFVKFKQNADVAKAVHLALRGDLYEYDFNNVFGATLKEPTGEGFTCLKNTMILVAILLSLMRELFWRYDTEAVDFKLQHPSTRAGGAKHFAIAALGDDSFAIIRKSAIVNTWPDVGNAHRMDTSSLGAYIRHFFARHKYETEVVITDKYWMAEFCSMRFLPTSGGIVLSSKAARCIAKSWTTWRPYAPAEMCAWARQVSEHYINTANHVPILNTVARRARLADWAVGGRDEEVKKDIDLERNQEWQLAAKSTDAKCEATMATWDAMAQVYNTDTQSLMALDEWLASAPTNPHQIVHPLLNQMAQVDIVGKRHGLVDLTCGASRKPLVKPMTASIWSYIEWLWQSPAVYERLEGAQDGIQRWVRHSPLEAMETLQRDVSAVLARAEAAGLTVDDQTRRRCAHAISAIVNGELRPEAFFERLHAQFGVSVPLWQRYANAAAHNVERLRRCLSGPATSLMEWQHETIARAAPEEVPQAVMRAAGVSVAAMVGLALMEEIWKSLTEEWMVPNWWLSPFGALEAGLKLAYAFNAAPEHRWRFVVGALCSLMLHSAIKRRSFRARLAIHLLWNFGAAPAIEAAMTVIDPQ